MPTPLRDRDPRRLGRYELVSRLGEGGMGAVYLGRAPEGELVAIKVIQAAYAAESESRERFRREVAAARKVARFCTAPVVDADLDGERPYIVSEYVDGPTLYDVVAESGPLPPSSLEALAVGMAGALNSIHAAGVIHRDLKPSNVLLSSVGPRVIDFGIARAMDFGTGLTMTRRQPGTPAFMAPEQHEGRTVTPAADIFAWGGVLAFAGTGRLPFGEGSEASVAYRVVYTEPDLDGLDRRLLGLVRMAMAKDPAARPSAATLLQHLVGGTGGAAPGDASAAAAVVERNWDGRLVAASPPTTAPAARWRGPGSTRGGTGPRRAPAPSAGALAGGIALAAVLAVVTWLACSAVAGRWGWAAALATAAPLLLGLGWLALHQRGPARVGAFPALVLALVAAGLAVPSATRSPVAQPGERGRIVPGRVATTTTLTPVVQSGKAGTPAEPVDANGDPLLLEDDFADDGGGWRTEDAPASRIAYDRADAALRVRTHSNFPSETAPAAVPSMRRSHTRIDVRRVAGARSGTVSINCRRNDRGDYYYFDVAMDGDFSIGKYQSAGPGPVGNEELRTGRARVGQSGFTRVEASCGGDGPVSLALQVNGTEVARLDDPANPISGSGRVSVGAYSPEITSGDATPSFEALIDNFAVWGQPG
jgi:hypothetical protein